MGHEKHSSGPSRRDFLRGWVLPAWVWSLGPRLGPRRRRRRPWRRLPRCRRAATQAVVAVRPPAALISVGSSRICRRLLMRPTRFARRYSRWGSRAGSSTPHDNLAAATKSADRRSDGQRQPDGHRPVRDQSGQPDDDGRDDLRRPVHRPRHHVRPDLAAGRPAGPADLAEHAHAGARPRLGVRRRARRCARTSTRPTPTARSARR